MHELAITRSVIELVETEKRRQGFSSTLEINLRVGEYSGIVPECIEDFFPLAAKGTAAEGARLNFEKIPAEFLCLDCGYEGDADRKNACCPSCRSTALKMTKGREFFVESLKVN